MYSLVQMGALVTSLMLIACNSPKEHPIPNDLGDSGAESAAPSRLVGSRSLIELIAVPDRHRGELVVITGFFTPDHEPPHGIMFLDDMSASMGILENALHVRFGKCRRVASAPEMLDWLDGEHTQIGYTIIQGVFEPAEPRGAYAGEICSVTRFSSLGPGIRFEKSLPDARSAAPRDAGSDSSDSR
jgi:hypothetical protein